MIKRRKRHQSSNDVDKVTRQTFTDKSQRLVPNHQESHEKHREEPSIFPRWCPALILVLTLFIRINYVTQKKNWWILHPDEVYQSMEVAHSELYGYGFRPYEYMAPPNMSSSSLTVVERNAAMYGMYSMRSFLLPRIYILVGWLCQLAYIDIQPFLLWKIFHTIVTSFLPLVTYCFTDAVSESHDTSVIASVLVMSSTHLSVFGTHTLVNSFLSPVILYSASVILRTLLSNKQTKCASMEQTKDGCALRDSSPNTMSKLSNMRISRHANSGVDCKSLTDTTSSNSNLKSLRINGNFENNSNARKKTQASSELDKNVISGMTDPSPRKQNGSMLISESLSGTKDADGYHSGQELVNPSYLNLFIQGLVIGLAIYIRLDISLFLVALFLPFVNKIFNLEWPTAFKSIAYPLVGVILGLVIGGADDKFTYGAWFTSPYQWFKFNVISDYSTKIFGYFSSNTYTHEVFMQNPANAALLIFSIFWCLLMVHPRTRKNMHIKSTNLIRLILSCITLFIFYSLKGHKETRFVHNVIVLLFIIYAFIFQGVVNLCFFYLPLKSKSIKLVLFLSLLLNSCVQYEYFPSSKNKSNSKWAYRESWDSGHVNQCLDFVSQQSDVTGVFLDRTIHMTGLYTLLHKDVPMFALVNFEFNELGIDSRLKIPSASLFRNKYDVVSVNTNNKISDYISLLSMPYLLKSLVEKKTYNYMIIKKDRKFVKFGYKEVYGSGNMKVLRRTFAKDDEAKLNAMVNTMQLGNNCTILELEGNWLMNYGLPNLAKERLLRCIAVGTSRGRPYLLLGNIYFSQGLTKEANNIVAKCTAILGKHKCTNPESPIVVDVNGNVRG